MDKVDVKTLEKVEVPAVEVNNQDYVIDIGNSKMKMMVVGEKTIIKQPSVITRLYEEPKITEDDLATSLKNLKDGVTVHITSKAVRVGTYAIGTQALRNSRSQNMDISLGNKHENDIPVVCTLGMMAADLVVKSYAKGNSLPGIINFKGYLSTSIPASEWSPEKASHLEKRFTDGSHTVVVYLNEKRVTVVMMFSGVKVTAEGLSAFYALHEAENDILEHLPQESDIKTPRQLKGLKKLGVDIGDGTTEYPYLNGLKPVLELCRGERRGVGHAKEIAMNRLNNELNGYLKINRQRFTEILDDIADKYHGRAREYMDLAKYEQADMIIEDVKRRFTDLSGDVDLCMVYGGGSVDLKEELFEELQKFCEAVDVKFLWIPEKYAEDLGVLGLEVLHRKVFFQRG